MSLILFLQDHRDYILTASKKRTLALAALRPTSEQLDNGLPFFFDQLIMVLHRATKEVSSGDEVEISNTAGAHGKEFLRLGYTLSHVVHSYGAMCQAITEVASITKAPITAMEFHNLNRCLDIAIAGAVTEFESIRNTEVKNREMIHLGTITHELRNVLSRARISFQMLSKGIVGLGGSTSKVLERSLEELDLLINRSLSEIRIRANTELNEEFFTIIEVISQLVVTAEIEAALKQQTLGVQVDPNISVKTDRLLVSAALGNIIQNALKFSKNNGNILIIGKANNNEEASIEVQDQCGGISPSKLQNFFQPFSLQDADKTGLGLGLHISKQAIEKCGGTLSVRNISGGCVFTVTLPISPPIPTPKPGPVV